jgi:Rps23 Pro-64 3,4-dihydroxylase Tpa1-like proline 4-hydroxylase
MINQKLLQNVNVLAEQYKSASPYPHIVIDNFLWENILESCLEEMMDYTGYCSQNGDTSMSKVQINKFFFPSGLDDDTLKSMKENTPTVHAALSYLQSKPAISFLSSLTGIQNLQGDDIFLGAGAHKVIDGGKLAIHTDFNQNWNTNLYRRINLLLYMNKNWKEEYGGELELWNADLSSCEKKILPIFNRVVIFTTSNKSYHGHPKPMTLPKNVARYSMALYYYTQEPPVNESVDWRSVTWQMVE